MTLTLIASQNANVDLLLQRYSRAKDDLNVSKKILEEYIDRIIMFHVGETPTKDIIEYVEGLSLDDTYKRDKIAALKAFDQLKPK